MFAFSLRSKMGLATWIGSGICHFCAARMLCLRAFSKTQLLPLLGLNKALNNLLEATSPLYTQLCNKLSTTRLRPLLKSYSQQLSNPICHI